MSDAPERLRAWLSAHPNPDEPIARPGGGQTTILPNGRKSMIMPYPIYSDTMKAFWAALHGMSGWTSAATGDYLDVTHRWLLTAGKRTVEPGDFARMERQTVLHFLRWIDRGERYCEGHWQGCFRQGLMHAAARALLALPSPPPEPSHPSHKAGAQGRLF